MRLAICVLAAACAWASSLPLASACDIDRPGIGVGGKKVEAPLPFRALTLLTLPA
jgi:hypothetical protein